VTALVRDCPVAGLDIDEAMQVRRRTLWPSLLMSFTDRMIAGVLTASIPTYFALSINADSSFSGRSLGLLMLLMAAGGWPAGWLSDAIGHVRLRTIAMLGYGVALAALPAVVDASSRAGVMTMMLAMGLLGSGLLPSGLALAARTGRGSVAMGAYHMAGNAGFLVGVIGSGFALTWARIDATTPDYGMVLLVTGIAYVVINLVASWELRRRDRLRSAAHQPVM